MVVCLYRNANFAFLPLAAKLVAIPSATLNWKTVEKTDELIENINLIIKATAMGLCFFISCDLILM